MFCQIWNFVSCRLFPPWLHEYIYTCNGNAVVDRQYCDVLITSPSSRIYDKVVDSSENQSVFLIVLQPYASGWNWMHSGIITNGLTVLSRGGSRGSDRQPPRSQKKKPLDVRAFLTSLQPRFKIQLKPTFENEHSRNLPPLRIIIYNGSVWIRQTPARDFSRCVRLARCDNAAALASPIARVCTRK